MRGLSSARIAFAIVTCGDARTPEAVETPRETTRTSPAGVTREDVSTPVPSPTPTPGSPSIVWFKFPAPPATSKTVPINVPEVGPFDGVPVTR